MNGRVLVAGFATRHVARSAKMAGYLVSAVDHFCDTDLAWYTEDRISFDELEEIAPAIDEMAGRRNYDILVLTSGAEGIASAIPLYGTPPEKIARFLDKLDIQHFIEGLEIPIPRLSEVGTFPAMIKPRCGSGGWRNRVLNSASERDAWYEEFEQMPAITQEVVDGIPASVCCLADGKNAIAIAVNEQILRGSGPGRYGFSGSVTPWDHPLKDQMIHYAEKIAAASGCVGTVGIDFMVGESVWAIEINPRFQGTLDTVEMATGRNLFSDHIQACRGILPEKYPDRKQFAARTILFADRDITINSDIADLAPAIADIPKPGTFVEDGKAVVSVYGWGATRDAALGMLDKNIIRVRQYIR